MSLSQLKIRDVHSRNDQGTVAPVALYPGSFKPPHASHVRAIRFLLNEVGASKVIVIVSNRCRTIPGTNLVVDATCAVHLFETMLRMLALPIDRIELVIARHRATSEAMRYIGSDARRTGVLLCVGEEDSGCDDRFASLQAAAADRGVSARIQGLPTRSNNVHSSQLRSQLAKSEAGLTNYIDCLPTELSTQDKTDLWADCRDRLQPIAPVVRRKIEESLRGQYDIGNNHLILVDASIIDPVFELRGNERELLIVKYAGDTTSPGSFGDPLAQKPARRIAVERRVIRHLSGCLCRSDFPTKVDFFDKERRVLVLAGRYVGATSVASEIASGVFSRQVASKAGELLARLHNCPIPEKGFWSDAEFDQCHWETLVATLTSQASRAVKLLGREGLPLFDMDAMSVAAQPGLVHLCFTPDNLWRHGDRVTFENLECAGNFGDAAYDIASFMSAYLLAGLTTDSLQHCLAAIEEFELAYRACSENDDPSLTNRVAILTAYQLLAATLRPDHQEVVSTCLSVSAELIERFDRGDTVVDPTTVAAWLRQTHTGLAG